MHVCVKEIDRLSMNSLSSNGEAHGHFQFNKMMSPKQCFEFMIILILMMFQNSLSFSTSVCDKLCHVRYQQQRNRCRKCNNVNINSELHAMRLLPREPIIMI